MESENKKEEILVEEQKQVGPFQLSRIARICIFVILTILSIIMSSDNGVLSSGKIQIRNDLGLTETEFGFFGSSASAGRMIGSIVFMGLLYTDKRKLLTLTCIFINGSFFFFYITKMKWLLFAVRFIIGSVRIYPHIYIPVWVDQFGVKKLKTLMMTVINITSPLGQTLGVTLGTLNSPDKWYLNYMVVGGLILGFGSLLLFFPPTYFSAKYNFKGYKEEGKDDFVKEMDGWKVTSFFEDGEIKKKEEKKQGSMLTILKNPVYVFSALVKANCLFCFQVIHINIKTYAEFDLGLPDFQKQKVLFLTMYGSATLLGPLLGGSFGGLCTTYVGGYEKKKSAICLVIFSFLTLFFSLFVIYGNNIPILCGGLFLFFFFASALLPIVGGYVVSAIPKEHKGAGSSLNLLISNLFGNLPGPIIYGFLKDYFKDQKEYQRLPWKIIIHFFTLGFVSSLISAYNRYRDLAKLEEEEKNKDKDGQELKEVTEGDSTQK